MRAVMTLALVLALLGMPARAADNRKQPPRPDVQRLYDAVRTLVRRHYPEATSHRLGNTIHFEQKTRVFLVHLPLKSGEWQDPVEMRGPEAGGIYGVLTLLPGRWEGAADVPQTFDRHYFTDHLLAPYSSRHNCHLHVSLLTPRLGVKPGFLKEFQELVNSFEKYLGEHGAGATDVRNAP